MKTHMPPLTITALTAASALGIGAAPHRQALLAQRTGLRPNDFDVPVGGFIGRVDAIEAHRLPDRMANFDCRNNRLADLALRADGFDTAVAHAVSRYGAHRIAVILGTSTSGVHAAEEAYRGRLGDGPLPNTFDYEHTQDLYSVAAYVRTALGLRGPSFVVSTACASSARCFLDAQQLIAANLCDAAIVGGADSLCRMTLQGFAALELVSPVPCRPCAEDRAGIAPRVVDWINLHGTGTRANDAAEDAAISNLFGDRTPCSSTKAWTGHTLGACGVLEALIARECIAERLIPGCLGITEADPTFRTDIVLGLRHAPIQTVLSNSFGFGGVNCALAFGV